MIKNWCLKQSYYQVYILQNKNCLTKRRFKDKKLLCDDKQSKY